VKSLEEGKRRSVDPLIVN